MNLLLEQKLENSPLNDKDKYEIRQFFTFLTDEKKRNLIANFDKIVFSIMKIKYDLRESQKILLWRAITNIENAIKKAKIAWVKSASKQRILNLKENI